ncbi:MAG: PTS sugar transporter subunit IIB [Candidatus Pelethousia sp.]|nr:PTS sugar transporter subunit IIB [Candidatus Pelethousia sp.]
MLRVVTMCAYGVGSSVLIKMNALKALKELNVEATVEVCDIISGKGIAKTADVILIGKELAGTLGYIDVPVIQIDSFVNKQEMREKLEAFCREKGLP